MCTILLPIKPEYVKSIFDGEKKYEYRKTKCTRASVSRIIIYATFPAKRIVGEAKVVEIVVDTPENVWENTKKYSGVNKTSYDKYFQNKEFAVAYRLDEVVKYEYKLDLKDIGITFIPQSFIYIDEISFSKQKKSFLD
ncbi:ASCH domain-containing protein [Acetivibrio cellulolyticus]|uniref:ASCH domain-containing protein n=1 Tax=Acetivibrio cellulolyticus TaxID=35830 RepID=UPI0001E2D4D3|nr:ASCH domain-containing protein [Acetivibrio cellulolyticus]